MTRSERMVAAVAATLLFCAAANPALAQQSILGSAKDAIVSLWDRFRDRVEGDTVSPVTPPSPTSLIHGIESGSDFWQHLRDAGYDLKDITSSIGIIPDIKMTFQLMRELSDADRDSLERKLEIDEIRNRGLVPAIQRQIVRTLLEASSLQEMRITELDITLLPLPSAEFVMEPKEAPLNEEHDQIFRALKSLDKKVKRSPASAEPKTD